MKRHVAINLTLAAFVAALTIFLYFGRSGFIEGLEHNTYDFRFKLRGSIRPDPKVAIIAIDEQSIKELGRFPWTRTRYSGLINAAASAGAKSLLFDAFFPEPESKSADFAFAESIKRSGITTLPVVVDFSAEGGMCVTENIGELQSSSRGPCHINITPDEDGVVRWTPLMIAVNGVSYPSLGLIGAKEALGAEYIKSSDYEILVGDKAIPVLPVDGQLRMLVNYSGPENSFTKYSFVDVLSGKVSGDELKDKILIVGATAVGIYDLRVTPFSNNMPGVEVNANVVSNILSGNFLRRGGFEVILDLLFIIILSLAVSLVMIRVRALIAFPLALALMAAYTFLAHFLFLGGHWVSMVYPIAGAVLSFSTAASLRFFVVERRAREIRQMFSNYVSKRVVDELVKHPELAKVGGQRKTLTILFADVRGYTTFSEKHSPEEVVKTLNEFLAAMTGEIIGHDGTLDKFLGDGIMAFWGAPLDQHNHPELAVRCACAMVERMGELQSKWKAEGREELQFGIGLNTGDVIVGNIGVEDKKMDYTVIGDNVNLTHRLQIQSREAMRPVISEALYEMVKDSIDAECLGEVAVKGRKATIKIFSLKGMKKA